MVSENDSAPLNVSPPRLAGEEKAALLNDPAVEPESVISIAWADVIAPAMTAQETRDFSFIGFLGLFGEAGIGCADQAVIIYHANLNFDFYLIDHQRFMQ